MTENIGKIKQVLGAVVDVSFEEKLPQILDALVVKHENKDLVLEESVFIDKNDVKETKQIVIKGITKLNREKIQWSLTKK